MTISQEELDSFYQIASDRVQNVGVESPEELFHLWKLLNPRPDQQRDIDASIEIGVQDIEAGRHRPAREVTEELRQKYGIPTE
jgi:hypothetical protein